METTFKDEIIAALKKQQDLRNALNEIDKQRDILIQQIDSCKNDIDLIYDRYAIGTLEKD